MHEKPLFLRESLPPKKEAFKFVKSGDVYASKNLMRKCEAFATNSASKTKFCGKCFANAQNDKNANVVVVSNNNINWHRNC